MKQFIAIISMCLASVAVAQEDIASLRGTHNLNDLSQVPSEKVWYKNKDGELIERNFELQPPLIPHKTKGYVINLKKNRCLGCHSMEDYEEEEASKMGDSHFVNREGKKLKTVSSGRYFCVQCHVQQVKNPALVSNTFQE